jgi:hypothetical protein
MNVMAVVTGYQLPVMFPTGNMTGREPTGESVNAEMVPKFQAATGSFSCRTHD